MRVAVVYAAPGIERHVEVILAPGAVVRDAVAASDLIGQLGLVSDDLAFAIYGQRVGPATPLADGDRVELLRPLAADPKERRRRHVQIRNKKDTN